MKHRVANGVVTAVLLFLSGSVYAQGMQNMPGMKASAEPSGNGSAHAMSGTVTALDSKTGIMEVNSEGMTLRVHFPPASLAGLKIGDTIQLGLSFKKM